MMKKLSTIIFVLALCGCQRQCQRMDKHYQSTERNYTVIMYSGGDTVFNDQFRGIINSEENSDGCYYYKGDTLIEVSGDYIIKSEK